MMRTKKEIALSQEWMNLIGEEFEKTYFHALRAFLLEEKRNYKVFPAGAKIFNALNTTKPKKTKVVIIGQDPYHGIGQANGLCFSVNKGVALPPSLRNIFKELIADVGIQKPTHGDLTGWAEQGVLLLNATLTVRENQAGAHQNKGWETFTDSIIAALNKEYSNLIFLLWGNYAKKKARIIDRDRHVVLEAAHPSPFAAHNGFFGCKHFSKTNETLTKLGKTPINWQI